LRRITSRSRAVSVPNAELQRREHPTEAELLKREATQSTANVLTTIREAQAVGYTSCNAFAGRRLGAV
jgi:hypothetical protein